MKKQHAHTLEAVFQHPLRHDLRMSDVEAMLVGLEAHVEHLSDHRLKLQLASGETMVLHAAAGQHHPLLDADGVLRLRRFLEEAGITPEHPETPHPHPRGDQAKRLVIHLDHRGARLWWLEGDAVKTRNLQSNGIWGSHQRLSHRRDRDMEGQKAPVDYELLNQLCEEVQRADRVLLLGHGHGQSDMRELLKKHLARHNPGTEERLETATIDDTACSDSELLALARRQFGNEAHR
ncbi:MAG: hypothetical protein EBS77_09840 [Gammaproteobacteria bacterium]|nr:hypothetical protein [Gammaproteobacteria bacterium]